MNRTIALAACVFVSGILIFIGSSFISLAAPNVTSVCGQISSNATWTDTGDGIYEVCSLGATVNPGVVLTIQPGVTVRFLSNGSLNVSGSLVASGTPTQPITFTGATAAPGFWAGIQAYGPPPNPPARINMDYVTIEYGGLSGTSRGQILIDVAAITMTHSLVRYSLSNGLYATPNAHVNIQDTHFSNNINDAVRLIQPVSGFTLANLSASGNGRDVVYVGGTTYLHGQRHWTNPGLPYILDGLLGNFAGDSLTIDPGNELQFTSFGYIEIAGEFKAIGLPTAPITFTSPVKTPGGGDWKGIDVYGGQQPANVQLDYVTVEYGGSGINGANISVVGGYLVAQHSIIRHSQHNGLYFGSAGRGSLSNSQIVSNTAYGVQNISPSRWVLAANNWWGVPSGPTSDVPACSQGTGDRVSDGVLFRPVLTDTNSTASFPLSDAPIITLTPRRWFAPADGISRIYFDISLRDGNGAPLPGRRVRISSNLGAQTDGGITDPNGRTLAYLVSQVAGPAEVAAVLDVTGCEGALSPVSQVTFTTPITGVDLMPIQASPYHDRDISVSPLPVTIGVPTTITARLTNPLTSTVTVDVEFEFVQAGIGLAFGPIKNITGQVIPAKSSVVLTASFVPSLAGHYCVQVNYTVTAIGTQNVAYQVSGSDPSRQLNLDVRQPNTSPPDKDHQLDKTRNALDKVNTFVDKAYDTDPFAIPLEIANRGIEWALNTAEQISNGLFGDPPRQDYKIVDTPQVLKLPPIQPGNGISAARAAALNELDDALAQANSFGTAAVTAFDRSGGAAEAYDLEWQSIQTAAMLEYNRQYGFAIITVSEKIDNAISVAASEGVTSIPISEAEVITMQQKLITSGFSAQEIADAHALGLTDAEIESIRQSIINANPADLAGDVITKMQQISQQLDALGVLLTNPVVFNPGFSVSGSAGKPVQQNAVGNLMAQVFNTVETIPVSNPSLTTTKTITLNVRRVDLPADWTVAVSPAQVTLGPQEQTTVTVSIIAGSPIPQGSRPSVAVEGWDGSELIGGVTIEVAVPAYRFFDGLFRVDLPLVRH